MKKICFIAQFPPPMHGLSKAVETLYNSNLNFEIDSQGEFEFEKVDITNNKNFIKNLLKISRSKADLFYFTISQTKGGNLRDLVIFKLLELQHKKCLIHLHGGYYRQLVDNDMAGWQRKANYKDVNQWLMRYWQLANGNFVPRSPDFGKMYIINDDTTLILKDIEMNKHKTICINDSSKISNFEKTKSEVLRAFEKKFPQKSNYEL